MTAWANDSRQLGVELEGVEFLYGTYIPSSNDVCCQNIMCIPRPLNSKYE